MACLSQEQSPAQSVGKLSGFTIWFSSVTKANRSSTSCALLSWRVASLSSPVRTLSFAAVANSCSLCRESFSDQSSSPALTPAAMAAWDQETEGVESGLLTCIRVWELERKSRTALTFRFLSGRANKLTMKRPSIESATVRDETPLKQTADSLRCSSRSRA